MPVGKQVIVTLRYHPLMFRQPRPRLIFFLSKPEEVSDGAEFRPLIGGEWEPEGLELATDDILEKVREAIRSSGSGLK